MASVSISDNTGNAKVVLFADAWSALSERLRTNCVYYFTLSQFEDSYTVKDVEEYIATQDDVTLKEILQDISYDPV